MPVVVATPDDVASLEAKVAEVTASLSTRIDGLQALIAKNAEAVAELRSQDAAFQASLVNLGNKVSDVDEQVAAIQVKLANMQGGGTSSPFTGFIFVDSYSGTDDQKLIAAIGAAKASNLKPLLILSAREWRFTQPIDAYTGFGITGPTWRSVEQARGGNPYPCIVKVSVSGGTEASPQPWIRFQAGNTFGCYIGNLTIEGSRGSIGIGSVNNGVMWTTTLHNLSWTNFACNLGYPGRKLLMTACTFSGYWNQNNHYVAAACIGGSDNSLWTDGSLMDSPPSFRGTPSGDYHLILDYMSKTVIGPLYMTAEQGSGIRVLGGSSTQGNTIITGARIEGRNASQSTYGALIRVEGGGLTLRDCWLGYAMSNPSAGSNPADKAVIEVSGSGELILGSVQYGLANGVTTATPLARATGSQATVVQEGYVSIFGQRRAKPSYAVSSGGAVLDYLGNPIPGVKTI